MFLLINLMFNEARVILKTCLQYLNCKMFQLSNLTLSDWLTLSLCIQPQCKCTQPATSHKKVQYLLPTTIALYQASSSSWTDCISSHVEQTIRWPPEVTKSLNHEFKSFLYQTHFSTYTAVQAHTIGFTMKILKIYIYVLHLWKVYIYVKSTFMYRRPIQQIYRNVPSSCIIYAIICCNCKNYSIHI